MPATKPKKNIPQFSTEFVRCELTTDDKKELAKWHAKPPMTQTDLLTEVLQANYKVSFSFNDNSDSFIVSVTGKSEGCNNPNKCYTSHAKTPDLALWVALFKYHVIWKGGVWEVAGDMDDFG